MDTSQPITLQRLIEASDADHDTLTTRHLLALLTRYRVITPDWDDDPIDPKKAAIYDRIKALLNTRGHVPTKREGKELRRKAAKAKH